MSDPNNRVYDECGDCRTAEIEIAALRKQLAAALAQRDAAYGFMAYYINCPCCEEKETCLDGCTFHKDCPEEARVMAEAREAMQGGEAR